MSRVVTRFWQFGVRRRLLVAAILPALLVSLLLGAVFVERYAAQLRQACEQRGFAIARQLAPSVEIGLFSGSLDALLRLAQTAEKADAMVQGVMLLDEQERILARTNPVDIQQVVMPAEATLADRARPAAASRPRRQTCSPRTRA